MISKSFDSWEYEEVEDTFGIQFTRNLPTLTNWLAARHPMNATVQSELDYLREQLLDSVDAWNEDELKYFFISPLVSHVKYNSKLYKSFTQRSISTTFSALNLEVGGRVEFMLARGEQRPKSPFFFIHEYKQERRRNNDPKGQLLISMVTAREKNKTDFPDFGCYVIGRLWFFVVLEGTQYSESLAYDATKPEDLAQIYSALVEIKKIAIPLFSTQ